MLLYWLLWSIGIVAGLDCLIAFLPWQLTQDFLVQWKETRPQERGFQVRSSLNYLILVSSIYGVFSNWGYPPESQPGHLDSM